ncbi:MAG: hypothetical protein OXC99_11285 [Chloroflexi bacterium]|nr:hypothetical protein [Chloroflexota bacterium]
MRIGINVPNELLKQVKEAFPSVNVSQFFREALQDRIKEEQRVKERVRTDSMDAPIGRLEQETGMPPEPDWEGLAWDDAATWVRNVTPEDWSDCVEDMDALREEGNPLDLYVGVWSLQNGSIGFVGHLTDYEAQLTKAVAPRSLVSSARHDAWDRGQREYRRAWLGYIYEVRRLIEQRRKERYERIKAEYDAALRASREPEAPEHLV